MVHPFSDLLFRYASAISQAHCHLIEDHGLGYHLVGILHDIADVIRSFLDGKSAKTHAVHHHGSGIRYLVIDAGWYKIPEAEWSQTIGSWIPSKELFPNGMVTRNSQYSTVLTNTDGEKWKDLVQDIRKRFLMEARVLAQLSREYDYVVVDTPPCGVVSDTRMLCHHADCIFYVVKIDGAHKLLISDSVAALHQQGVTLDGVIVNGIPRHKIRTDYGYAKKYGRSRT